MKLVMQTVYPKVTFKWINLYNFVCGLNATQQTN